MRVIILLCGLLVPAQLLIQLVESAASYSRHNTDQISAGNEEEDDQEQLASRSVVAKLSRSAPYAIESSNGRNLVFRLAPANQTAAAKLNSTEPEEDDEPWTFVTKNGTLIGSRANLNLKKLLETLDNNNFTSEVKFGDDNGAGLVNITISSSQNQGKIDAIILEELMSDASNSHPVDWRHLLNGSTIFKDNHRFESRHPIRMRPAQLELLASAHSNLPPPIRSSIELVAENYTIRRVTEEANMFAIKLLHQLNLEKLGIRNLVQSPFAIYQGMGLLLTGAAGETAKEMDRVLLGSGQSAYELSTKLQSQELERPRLVASFNDVIRQLHYSATHHQSTQNNDTSVTDSSRPYYLGGSPEQHLIVANNLLFSPSAFEISPEFKASLNSYYNNTALTRIEIGSTESIHVVNSWIRQATGGLIPTILHKKSTFDEFNVMALLCTSWLAQEWKDQFYRVSSPLRSSIRLKGQGRSLQREWTLMEFVDDHKQSHFVDFIKSRPSGNILHYQSVLSGLVVDLVAVPFKDSSHRLITLTPLASSSTNATQLLSEALVGQVSSASAQVLQSGGSILANQAATGNSSASSSHEQPDVSLLSRLIAAFASNPRKATRSLWNIVAPEIITKQTLQNMPTARPKNVTDESGRIVDTVTELPLVQLSMPMIRTEADSSVSAALNHIGFVNSFDPDQANFIGINGHPFNYYKLHLSNVLSKTTFNLNERGINYDKTIRTLESLRIFPDRKQSVKQDIKFKVNNKHEEDGDSTAPQVDDVKLNKPFMYFICDMKTKLILYTGIMRNPEQEGA